MKSGKVTKLLFAANSGYNPYLKSFIMKGYLVLIP